jgi:hypothetical protein
MVSAFSGKSETISFRRNFYHSFVLNSSYLEGQLKGSIFYVFRISATPKSELHKDFSIEIDSTA